MAYELHLLYEKCEPAGVHHAEGFCLDEGRDDEATLKRRDDEMRGRKTLKVNICGARNVEVEVLEVRDRANNAGVTFRVKHEGVEYDVHYGWLNYAD